MLHTLARLDTLVRLALEEDLGDFGETGDLTSHAILPTNLVGRAVFIARQAGTIAGLPAAQKTFAFVDATLAFQTLHPDGSVLNPGEQLAIIQGRMCSILRAERTALNFVQHLSGVATLTRRYVDAIAGLPCKILDTRKTIPGWRVLEKYAVRCGGGQNHRFGLSDGILIKDNHLAALRECADPIGEAIRLARQIHNEAVPIEIEVDTLEQFEIALRAGPDIILLDNMPPSDMREAVQRRNATAPGVLLEASGGVTLETIRAIAETGVDRISVGALTHSAPALDIGLDYLQ